MREVNLNGIEEKYNQVKAFMGTLGQINHDFNTEQGITEDYLGPFNQRHELERLVADVRKNLISFLVEKLNAQLCPNVTINASDIEKQLTEKFGELGFSADFIHHHIQANFVTRSATLSYEEILTKAKYLLPSLWDNHGRRKLTLDELVKGRKLVLNAFIESCYPNSREGLTALEKFAKIVLDDEDPTRVSSDEISTIYWHKRGDDYYRTYELQDKNIDKVRAYKNNKFLIYFKDEEKARKVATALLEEHTTENR